MRSLFDVRQVPFSYHGSWMSISIPRGKDGLFFRNHHMRPNDLFAIRTVVSGETVEPRVEARPDSLALHVDGGRVDICFESPDTVRMRGVGDVDLRLEAGNIHAYVNGPNLAVFNLRQAYRRYQFEALQGDMSLSGAYGAKAEWDTGQQILHMAADESGHWELAIDEFWSSWRRPARAPFEACREAARQAAESFRASMPEAPAELAAPQALASYINWSCTVKPCGLVKRPTLFMSKNWMSKVWSWDQCFNALALAGGQPALAMDQMLTLVDHQDAFGAYTDAFTDMELHYNFAKPPVHGFMFRALLKRLPQPPADDVMATMYASLGKQAEWWMQYRRLSVDAGVDTGLSALPYYLHGNDSGWDNSTMFGKGVPLVAPDLCALLVIQMDVLSELAEGLGRVEETADWRQRADMLFENMMTELWRGDRFVARLANDGLDVESLSLIPWLTLVLGERLPADARESLRAGLEKHLTEWGVATERVDSPRYKPNGYWQGPIWAPSTYLAVAGLDLCGHAELADTVAERFCRLCGKSGMAENYDAVTGAPLCDTAYTWTASVFLLLAERLRQNNDREAESGDE